MKAPLTKFSRKPKRFQFREVSLGELESTYGADLEIFAHKARNDRFEMQDFGAWQIQIDSEILHGARQFRDVIDDLIGIRGMDRPNSQELLSHLEFLSSSINPYFSVRKLIADFNNSPNLVLTDLGSVCDVAIIKSFLGKGARSHRILEIGGGYGRLAQALTDNGGYKLSYDMVDVVPSSLALAKSYLSMSGLSVADGVGTSNPDSVLLHLPSSVENLPDRSVDLAINVESFQEMTQEWVDYWVSLINRKTKAGSYVYQSNAFEYRNMFDLNLGTNWRLLKSINHPRHWTNKHRTEVWQRVF